MTERIRRIGTARLVGSPWDFGAVLTLTPFLMRLRFFPFYRAYDIPVERIIDVQPRLYRWFWPSPAFAARFRDEQGQAQTLVFSSLRPLYAHHFGPRLVTQSAPWPSAWLSLPPLLAVVCAIPLALLFSDVGGVVALALPQLNNLIYPRWGCRAANFE